MSKVSEKGIIGCLLIDSNCMSQITHITEGMFTDDFYRAVFIEFLNGYRNGEEVEEATLRWVLGDRYPIEVIDKELLECINSVSTSVEIKTHAEIVYRDYQAREAENILQHTQIKGQSVVDNVKDIIGQLENLIQEDSSESKSVAELSVQYKDTYFKEKAEKDISLGIGGLREYVDELEKGDIIVIGARPSVGKSALVVQIATNICNQNKKVGFFNMEMSDKQIYERFLSHVSGLSLERIRRAIKYNEGEQEKFDRGNNILQENFKKIDIVTGVKTVSQIRTECKNKDYDIIIIDYLQLVVPESTYRGNRFAEVGDISRKLKSLAMEMQIPIIALSQLNRVSEAKETKEPTMSELRESGNVEQDASIIILMWNLDEERKKKGVKVDKNRQGKTGNTELIFNGEQMRFVEEGDWQEVDENMPFI